MGRGGHGKCRPYKILERVAIFYIFATFLLYFVQWYSVNHQLIIFERIIIIIYECSLVGLCTLSCIFRDHRCHQTIYDKNWLKFFLCLWAASMANIIAKFKYFLKYLSKHITFFFKCKAVIVGTVKNVFGCDGCTLPHISYKFRPQPVSPHTFGPYVRLLNLFLKYYNTIGSCGTKT